jgi:hypothetical protein
MKDKAREETSTEYGVRSWEYVTSYFVLRTPYLVLGAHPAVAASFPSHPQAAALSYFAQRELSLTAILPGNNRKPVVACVISSCKYLFCSNLGKQ